MECFGTTDFDNNSRLITLSAIIISGLHCIYIDDVYIDSRHCVLVALYAYVGSLTIVYDNLPCMQHKSNKRVAPYRGQNISPKHVAAWYNKHKHFPNSWQSACVFPFSLGGEYGHLNFSISFR